ncbi:LysR substrate-binding domain-containing protein [Burkholderia glumae]|uniref:LysR substrate-binding domain-containing protein n=1 Tax=Burkholderia glumae TaxID=337 RepID=UPI00214F6853|nr:LysR substrate-binding domain-containing protein [Burkholderia glumae]
MKIGEFSCHLYGSQDYFARRGTPTSVAELPEHEFAGYIDELIQLDIVRWLEEGVANPTYSFHSSSMLSQMFAAAAGAGLVMLPAFSRPERFGLYPVLLGEINVRREVWMSTLVNFQRVPSINVVLFISYINICARLSCVKQRNARNLASYAIQSSGYTGAQANVSGAESFSWHDVDSRQPRAAL